MPDLADTLDHDHHRARLQAALRDELIQIAAVAVAMIQDLDYGTTEMTVHTTTNARTDAILIEVEYERHRQEGKWGPQHHDPRAWLTILGEEFGEACQAALRLTHQQVRDADFAEGAE